MAAVVPTGFVQTTIGGCVFTHDRRWKLTKQLGSGAYGVVALAVDGEGGGRVAIKKIGHAYADLVDAKRILREIKLMKTLGAHENLVELVDLETVSEDIYIFSRAADTDLHRVIFSKQVLSEEHVKYFTYQMLRGLKFLHSASVLHRDLKPSNLFLDANCDLRIGDYGLARVAGDGDPKLTEYVVTRWYRGEGRRGAARARRRVHAGCVRMRLRGQRILLQYPRGRWR